MSNLFLEQDTNLDLQFPTETIYTDKSVWLGSYLGGPLVAGYIIAQNFKAFNESAKAKITWVITIIATVLIFGLAFSIPQRTPSIIIPLIYTGIAYLIIRQFQGEKIAAHIKAGGATHSWLKVLGVAIIGLIITMIPVLGIAFTLAALETSTTQTTQTYPIRADYPTSQLPVFETPMTKTYGKLKNEISFLKSNISEEEVDSLADGLTKIAFFKEAPQKFVYAKKVDNNYEIFISCNKSVTTNLNLLTPFVQLRKNMQKSFPNNKIIFNFVVDSIDNVIKRME